jgi:hypothetical protein
MLGTKTEKPRREFRVIRIRPPLLKKSAQLSCAHVRSNDSVCEDYAAIEQSATQVLNLEYFVGNSFPSKTLRRTYRVPR